MHPSATGCDKGEYTYFASSYSPNKSKWSCKEPSFDTKMEWAYGGCFGKCGGGCDTSNDPVTGGTQFTWGCLDHDLCVRFGNRLGDNVLSTDPLDRNCDDEFLIAAADKLLAPNCFGKGSSYGIDENKVPPRKTRQCWGKGKACGDACRLCCNGYWTSVFGVNYCKK